MLEVAVCKSRFETVVGEGNQEALPAMAAYFSVNPIRAGMAEKARAAGKVDAETEGRVFPRGTNPFFHILLFGRGKVGYNRGRRRKRGDKRERLQMDKDRMTKRELAMRVTERLGDEVRQYVVAQVIQATLDEIAETLRSGRGLELRRFGVFEVTERGARVGRNPRKPAQTVNIPAMKRVKFRPGTELQLGSDGKGAEA